MRSKVWQDLSKLKNYICNKYFMIIQILNIYNKLKTNIYITKIQIYWLLFFDLFSYEKETLALKQNGER